MESIDIQKMEESRYQKLEQTFKEAIQQIIEDPIMDCFRENKESQGFMFDRMKEIISENMQQANDKYVKEVLTRMEDMNRFSNSLKEEIKHLNEKNSSLQRQHEQMQQNFKTDLDASVKDLTDEIKELNQLMNQYRNEKDKLQADLGKAMDRSVGLEQELRSKEEKIRYLSEELDNADSIIKRLKASEKKVEGFEDLQDQLLSKDKEIDRLKAKLGGWEKHNRKADIEFKELQDEFERRLGKLESEKRNLEMQLSTADVQIKEGEHAEEYKTKMLELETKIKNTKIEMDEKDQKIEENEFTLEQLEQTIKNVKTDLKDMTKKMSEERRCKHEIEIKMIDLKDKYSEVMLKKTEVLDDFEKAVQELNYVKSQLELRENDLKVERRKAATIEREFEQLKFSTETSSIEVNDQLNTTRDQFGFVQQENQGLHQRIDGLIKEHQKRIEDERSAHHKTKTALNHLQEIEEKLKIENENLKKKVEYFRQKILKRFGSDAQEHNLKDQKALKQQLAWLKKQLAKLRSTVIGLNKSIEREKHQASNEVKYYKNTVNNIFEMLTLRLKEESKKSNYYQRDIIRLKKDVSYLEKINGDYATKSNAKQQPMTPYQGSHDPQAEEMAGHAIYKQPKRMGKRKERAMVNASISDHISDISSEMGPITSERDKMGRLRKSSAKKPGPSLMTTPANHKRRIDRIDTYEDNMRDVRYEDQDIENLHQDTNQFEPSSENRYHMHHHESENRQGHRGDRERNQHRNMGNGNNNNNNGIPESSNRTYLSPIKPMSENSYDDGLENLEISQIKKESMEIERRISRLKKRSDPYTVESRDGYNVPKTGYKARNKENLEFNNHEYSIDKRRSTRYYEKGSNGVPNGNGSSNTSGLHRGSTGYDAALDLHRRVSSGLVSHAGNESRGDYKHSNTLGRYDRASEMSRRHY